MPKTRPPYPAEFKTEAVRLCRASDKPRVQIARELGLLGRVAYRLAKAGRRRRGPFRGTHQQRLGRAQAPAQGEPDPARGARDPEEGGRFFRTGGRPQVKFAFIKTLHLRHSLAAMCRLLAVSRSGFYHWLKRKPSRRARADERLKDLIHDVWEGSGRIYGSPRVWAELRADHGVRCARKRVERLMREMGIRGRGRGGRKRSLTRRDPSRPPAADLIRRNFRADRPDRIWLADISYIETAEGWLYLSAILDLYSRRVVGWSMREDLESGIVIDALAMAIRNRRPGAGLIHHSDRGSQYTSLAFGQELAASSLVASMGSAGAALDNAPAESFFATLKSELIDGAVYPTRDLARTAVFEYIEVFYNRRRRHSSLDYMSPDEYERAFRQREEGSKAA